MCPKHCTIFFIRSDKKDVLLIFINCYQMANQKSATVIFIEIKQEISINCLVDKSYTNIFDKPFNFQSDLQLKLY